MTTPFPFATCGLSASGVPITNPSPALLGKESKCPTKTVTETNSFANGLLQVGQFEQAVFEARLLDEVHSLSIGAYELLIARLLQAAGYDHVQILRDPERQRRSHKGRNRHGGVDIKATSRVGLSTGQVLVQVKQYARPVSRRFVDELRGALLRCNGRYGLLVTTSTFAPAAREAAREEHRTPVHLVDGPALARLLMLHRLGTRRDQAGVWHFDWLFFDSLEVTRDDNPIAPDKLAV